jgi:hypothetical protein
VHRFSIRWLKLRPLIWPGASHTPPETQQKRASTTPCQLRLPWPTRLVRSRKTAQQSRSRIAIPGPAPLKHLGWVKLLHQHGTAHLQITGGWATPGLRCRDSWSISRWDGMGWDGMGSPRSTLLEGWKFGTIRSSHSEIDEMGWAP